jgi:hypothetical protein
MSQRGLWRRKASKRSVDQRVGLNGSALTWKAKAD